MMTNSNVYIYGIDLGKKCFHMIAMDKQGHILSRQKLTRSQMKKFVINTPLRLPKLVAWLYALCAIKN
ncbi:hypothetical protein KDD30_16245 [Photobacterium sp. GJ3]|uniref:hypothetical protein n=1 Tax=Photobacterium sp. GJ3 TaxID=2829502 RepID=UPI001B8CDEB3|nr:hypothetical protein [Photobacterium sp. GJ3]QUJ67540.1 hypothetical protein KDD30_16245 [Photobacterium sp. GJ3]